MSWFAKAFFTVRMQEYCSRQQGRYRPSVPKGRLCLVGINSLLATMLCMCPCSKLSSRFCSRIPNFQTEAQSLRKPTESSCAGFHPSRSRSFSACCHFKPSSHPHPSGQEDELCLSCEDGKTELWNTGLTEIDMCRL